MKKLVGHQAMESLTLEDFQIAKDHAMDQLDLSIVPDIVIDGENSELLYIPARIRKLVDQSIPSRKAIVLTKRGNSCFNTNNDCFTHFYLNGEYYNFRGSNHYLLYAKLYDHRFLELMFVFLNIHNKYINKIERVCRFVPDPKSIGKSYVMTNICKCHGGTTIREYFR